MKWHTIHKVIIIALLSVTTIYANAQRLGKPQNLPFADQKLYHLGFFVGIHTQDLTFTHTGATDASGRAWFSEIPSYRIGFSVGMLADRYLNHYFNLRIAPTLHFGEKKFIYKEQNTGAEYENSVKGSYISLPLLVKFSASRKDNYRPYVLAGAYASMDLSNKKNDAIRFEKMDYGLEFGVGCNFYLSLFKFCPEVKFSLGLADIINNNASDITDNDMLPYRNAIKSGKTRMISLVFNFE